MEVPKSPDEEKEISYCFCVLLIARMCMKSDTNIMPKPKPIIFKLNSVHLERASSATFARKLEYTSICLLRAGNTVLQLSLLYISKFFVVPDHFSTA